MNDIPFFRTRMGQRFYESTLPDLVRQLERLNGNLEKLLSVAPSADDKPGVPDERKEP